MNLLRQQDITDERLYRLRTAVVGAGGIGSFLAVTLAKMGVQDITICDPDKVESHNIPNQFYGPELVGLTKVSSLAAEVKMLTGLEIVGLEEEVAEPAKLPPHDVLIAAVDSMRARKTLFENRRRDAWFIDGRMGAQMAWVLCVPPGDYEAQDYYLEKLYSDEEASDEPCTAQATIYGGLGIASIIASVVRRVAMEDSPPREVILDYVTWSLLVAEGGE